VKYAFIFEHQDRYAVQPLCRLVGVARSEYYAWGKAFPSQRARDDERLLGLIREYHEASGRIFGVPRILCDLRAVGERVGKNRVAWLMQRHQIRAQRGYKQPGVRYTKPAVAAPNRLQQQFTIDRPVRAWGTDITYIRTYEGWLYLTARAELFDYIEVFYNRARRHQHLGNISPIEYEQQMAKVG